MHRTKRAARNIAWTDSKNPFAKRWAYRTEDVPSRMENGDSVMLFRPNTDDPSSYPHHDPDSPVRDWNVDNQPKHADTSPAAVSRRRINDPGEQIGELPQSSSPAPSIKKSQGEKESTDKKSAVDVHGDKSDSEKTKITESNSDVKQEDDKSHGVQGWVHGMTHKKDKEASEKDDNNGKNKKGPKFTPVQQIKATLFNSWINVLLILSPIGIAVHFAKINDVAIFIINFIAIIPLAALLSYATEEIALRTGEVLGGLLNASFGNAVELIVSIIALTQNQILIVQTSLIGSMLSNLLLVMGMCFFAGGVNRMEQAFNLTVAQTASSLLFLAVSSLIIPTAFLQWAKNIESDTNDLNTKDTSVSRATAILLLVVYACYLFFQLKSHADVYNAAGEKNKTRDFSKQKNKVKSLVPAKIRRHSLGHSDDNSETQSHVEPGNENANDDGDDREEPQLSIWVAIGTLIASTVLVALNAEFLVDSIDAITCTGGVSKNFVGLILLPIVGNAAEHATAVTVAIKDKMDLAIGVAVGSSMQIALLVLPFVVVLGWIIGKDDMTLNFDGFQIAVLFVAVLLVNYLIQDGKSHWLEGVLLMILYIIIAVAAWFYPTAAGLNDCPASG